MVGAGEVVIGCLPQVRELFPENGIFTLEVGEVVQPRDGGELEVMIRLQAPEHVDVALVDLVRRNGPMIADRFVAAAVSACRCFHA